MDNSFYIKSHCRIKNSKISLNTVEVFERETKDFIEFIKAAYKSLDTKYPKFFKMDRLSKLAFIAADVLLKNENLNPEIEQDIAVVLSNKASSLDTDRKHQKAIQDKENYYPSPAVFVYTLPNICIGEISIKYKLYSENSFFIFDSLNAEHLSIYSNSLLETNKAKEVLCGWVELDGDNYDAFLYLVSTKGKIEHTKQNIDKLYKL
ncbi:3-oxoacyl-ACP synthase [uncultured Lacinutrix sp.]|uniref:3-oxoacyl-ACP synthase n=1 Tax=uncultured Lacinutrix sp. TaxID=574032 RepID=UPI00262767D9|nr:3-oxoacyl-ACP synthase [uncultured Lacinutrix sp.]